MATIVVSFDSTGAGVSHVHLTSTNWTHTIGASATAVVVGVTTFFSGTNHSPWTRTVSIGGVNAPSLGVISNANGSGKGWVELFGLVGPVLPRGLQTITYTCTNAANIPYIGGANSIAYNGVSAFGPAITAYGSNTTVSTGNIASQVTNNMVVGVLSSTVGEDLSAPNKTQRFVSSAKATNYNDCLIQDSVGAATVALSATDSAGIFTTKASAAIGVNLIYTPHDVWVADASLPITVAGSANALQTNAFGVNAVLAVTATPTASTVSRLTTPLRYVGRYPDSDGSVVPKAYADAANTANAVTPGYVNQKLAEAQQYLSMPAYVDQQDLLRAKKTAVDAADANYVPVTQFGVANGVATTDLAGNITTAQLPGGIVTDRVAKAYSISSSGVVNLTAGQFHTVTSTSLREFQIARLDIPDPGYPWTPLCFAQVQGSSGGVDTGNRQTGNGAYGLLTVLPPSGVSDTVYGAGACTANFRADYHELVPYGTLNSTPLTSPAINGALELGLYGCVWSGSQYIFGGTGLVYWVLVLPSI